MMTDGYYVFAGTAIGASSTVVNPVIRVNEGSLQLISSTAASGNLWYYDVDEDILKDNGKNSSALGTNLIEQIGWTGTALSFAHDIALEREMIIGKVYPV